MLTSDMPIAFRPSVPLKMTSAISEPRKALADCSPSTQRMASAMLDLPQPFGPTMAVTPRGSSRTVRSMNDLKPFSSICLIRIWVPRRPPRGRHTRGWRPRALIRHQLRVPVRRIHRAQKGHPLLVATQAVGLRHERRPLRPPRQPDQPHPRLRRRTPALQAVAAVAGAHDVLPHRRAAPRARHDVVEVQLGARELPAAVLAAVPVARVDVEAAEAHVAARDAIV